MSGARPQSKPPQRWPDIMIAVLTLALLGGFGALLLDQKSKAPAAAQPVTTTAPTAAIPASPATVPPPAATASAVQNPAAQSTTAQNSAVQTTATTPAPSDQTSAAVQTTDSAATTSVPPASASAPTSTASTPAATTQASAPAVSTTEANTVAENRSGVASTSQIPPVPKAPPVQAITPPVMPKTTTEPQQTAQQPATTSPAAEAAEKPKENQTAADTPAPAPAAVTPRSGGAVATSADRTPLRSEYRISLGSFATSKTVDTQTSAVSGLGYKVHAIDLGNQYVAQIGPFADEATARQALADIHRAYPGALLYRPRVKAADTSDNSSSDSGPSDRSTDNSSTASSRSDNASSAPAASAPAPDGPRYLQVGAFDRPESAQKLVGILRDHDFAPTVSSPADSKTTVMVGPYSGGALLRAEARLDNAGLDHFRVR